MTVTYDYTKRTSYTDNVETQKRAHKILLEVPFTPSLPERGYTNRTLHVDLGAMKVTEKAVTEEMKTAIKDACTTGGGEGKVFSLIV